MVCSKNADVALEILKLSAELFMWWKKQQIHEEKSEGEHAS